jgi:hypothetical protein
MHCIICRTEKKPSSEHVIPRALGGSFVIYRVCHDCNAMLGARRVDQGLIEHSETVERRVKLQLAGNNKTVPDPVAEAIRRPIETGIPNVRVRLARGKQGYVPTVQPHVGVEIHEENGLLRVDINLIVAEGDEHNAPMYLKSALRKNGVRDDAVLERICADTIPRLQRRQQSAPIGIPIKRNEGGHFLGLTKIAYEMAHHWLGDTWLDDSIAASMRRALCGDKSADGRFRIGDGAMLERPRMAHDRTAAFESLPLGYDPQRTNVMTLYSIQGSICVCLWLLDAFTAMFVVTETGKAYPSPTYDAVAMDVVLRRFEEFESITPAVQ